MPSNQGFILTTKSNNNSLVSLYPQTTKEQVINWDLGEIFGPYQITLLNNDWVNNEQIIELNGVDSNDIIECNPILSGTLENMQMQSYCYSLLLPQTGIQSLQNQVKFSCIKTPPNDFIVSLIWTR